MLDAGLGALCPLQDAIATGHPPDNQENAPKPSPWAHHDRASAERTRLEGHRREFYPSTRGSVGYQVLPSPLALCATTSGQTPSTCGSSARAPTGLTVGATFAAPHR